MLSGQHCEYVQSWFVPLRVPTPPFEGAIHQKRSDDRECIAFLLLLYLIVASFRILLASYPPSHSFPFPPSEQSLSSSSMVYLLNGSILNSPWLSISSRYSNPTIASGFADSPPSPRSIVEVKIFMKGLKFKIIRQCSEFMSWWMQNLFENRVVNCRLRDS